MYLRNPGRDISFPIFTRKEIETKTTRKEIKTIISRVNHFLSFLFQYITEKKLKQEYWKGNQNKNISFYRLYLSFIQHNDWLIFSPMGGQEYIDISRHYVDISRFLKVGSCCIKYIVILLPDILNCR